MRYLLDTNTCSHLLRGHPTVAARLAGLPTVATACTSVIAQGELLYGAYHASENRRQKLMRAIRRLLGAVSEILGVTPEVATRYAQVKAQLASQGTPIPANDIWVAAVALEADLILVSDDAHFAHVSDLRIENWLG